MLRLLHFYLIASILACPFVCRSGLRACVEECCAVESSSYAECSFGDHCHDEPTHHEGSHEEYPVNDRDPARPGPGDHGPCESCQCVCGGAVVVENTTDLFEHAVKDTLHHIASVNHHLISDLDFRQRCRTVNLHGWSITPSRILCVLHESFLL